MVRRKSTFLAIAQIQPKVIAVLAEELPEKFHNELLEQIAPSTLSIQIIATPNKSQENSPIPSPQLGFMSYQKFNPNNQV